MTADARTARIKKALTGAPAGPDRVLAAREFDDFVGEYQRLRSFAEQYGYRDAEVTQRIEVPRG